MIFGQAKPFDINMYDNLSKFMASFDKKEKEKPEIPIFPHDVSTGGSVPIASQPQYEMSFNFLRWTAFSQPIQVGPFSI